MVLLSAPRCRVAVLTPAFSPSRTPVTRLALASYWPDPILLV